MKDNKKKVMFLILQVMNIVFSLDSVLIKCASVYWEKEGLFSFKTCSLLVLAVLVLAIYAVIWQMILTQISLSVAYLSKGLVVFWGLLWSVLFFCEKITVVNIIGAVLIFLGTLLVNDYE